MTTQTATVAPPSNRLDAAAEARKSAPRFYRPELDALRCLAFLMVLTHHTFPIDLHATHFGLAAAMEESGSSGVCLFFLLSAYLITELLLRERENTGTIHIPSFYVRRVLRIWPLYFLILGFGALLPFFVHRYSAPLSYMLPNLLLVGNWPIVLQHRFPHNAMLGTLWSISVEEQFYLLWPAVVLWFGRRGILLTCLLVLPLAWATDWIIPAMHLTREPDLWCDSFSQFQFFALGGLLALLFHKRPFTLAPAVRLLMLAGAAMMLLIAAFPFHFLNPSQPFHQGQALGGYLCIDVGCLLLFSSFLNAKLPRAARPFIYLGKISYGLYMFHFPIRVALGAVIDKKLHLSPAPATALLWATTLCATILISWLSYERFEKPFLKLKRRFTFVPSRAA